MLLLLKFFQFFLAVSAAYCALNFRTPTLSKLRPGLFLVIIAVSLILMLLEVRVIKERKLTVNFTTSLLILLISGFTLTTALTTETKFQLTKQMVFHTPPSELEELGGHFVVGYGNYEEVKNLVEKRAIAGVFITKRNIQDKTKSEIYQQIQTLQSLRASQGLSPLLIATDQEGGIVSRLSPPLTKLPSLSKAIAESHNIETQEKIVIEYAKKQSKELSQIGINLNFAPVVDLNKGIINPDDKYSQIYKRAISTDKEVVSRVASWYCQNLEPVKCTLKHFPGLGRVTNDTHLDEAELTTSVEELNKDDWVPFRQASNSTQALIMLAHAKLIAVDAQHPVSFSEEVVKGILRDDWQYHGILITDDFSMGAVYKSEDGLENATVKAINAGVDLILIAYDPDLYYEAVSALLKAKKQGSLDSELLGKSKMRLERLWSN